MKSIIKAKNIHRKFGEGALTTHVLKGIDMDVECGEFLVIMGKSGAGKSTLLYQISGLDEPSEGEIIINEIDIIKLSEQARTSFRLNQLGFIFQNYALMPDLSAVENVMLPLLMRGYEWDQAYSTAQSAIDEVGMAGKYKNLPSELSGGEQQRISIARAVAGKPNIIFADEPTANLDSVSGNQVIELITKINRESGQTIVMVTHEREYAKNCDRILHMEDGQITKEENRNRD